MDNQTILHISLVLHLMALAMAGGVTLAGTVANRTFWKLYDQNKEHGMAAFRSTLKFRIVGMMGLGLLILTGIIMLWMYEWTLAQLLWFKIKMVIVLLLFVNGFTLGRVSSQKLERVLKGEAIADNSVRSQLHTFQVIQLSLFAMIIILAVFRFT